jgi:hypothetical protein
MFAQINPNRMMNPNHINPSHARLLWLYLMIVLLHWLEHLCQMYQIYVLGWMPKAAGGVLGLWWPWLASSEILHVGYNGLLWGGMILLMAGFVGNAQQWWKVSFALQTFHLFEHLLLFAQWLAGLYLFGAAEPTSIGQLWIRRPELHFAYNLAVFVPMLVAVWLHWKQGGPGGRKRRSHAAAEVTGNAATAAA